MKSHATTSTFGRPKRKVRARKLIEGTFFFGGPARTLPYFGYRSYSIAKDGSTWTVMFDGTPFFAGLFSAARAMLAVDLWKKFHWRKARKLIHMLYVNPRNYSGCYGPYLSIAKIKALVRGKQ